MVELTKEELEADINKAIEAIKQCEQVVLQNKDIVQRNLGIIAYCQEQLKKFEKTVKE